MKRIVLLVTALLLAVAFGLAEGLWTGRWNPSIELDRAAARVVDVPRSIGEWEGVDTELESREIALAKLKGHFRRTYANRRTGETVTAMLLCGQPGPIAAHTPDICFQGQGSKMTSARTRQTVSLSGAPSPAGEFFSARFERTGTIGAGTSTVLWAWSVDGYWESPELPRIHYARSSFLYKLYLIHQVGVNESSEGNPVLTDFLEVFLPAARVALFRQDTQ